MRPGTKLVRTSLEEMEADWRRWKAECEQAEMQTHWATSPASRPPHQPENLRKL